MYIFHWIGSMWKHHWGRHARSMLQRFGKANLVQQRSKRVEGVQCWGNGMLSNKTFTDECACTCYCGQYFIALNNN